MEIVFSDHGWEDYLYWKETNTKILEKINLLISEIKINPTYGIGEVIALRYSWTRYYTRRISLRHRLIYKIDKDKLFIVSCRYHH